ncbi:MAG: helix-turn-helix transcriptional regulator [Clostridia bacterium]|nr:helix-turn-helix transcriptional regulator [Clostridia bacterium]
MNIGEKIKKLRTAKLMTQSELVGNEITRNMLSRIEHGAANPSLETICYIASRLNVSPGFLLAEEGDEEIYFKHNEIVGIKKLYLNEDYQLCRDICLHAESARDDEIQMILAECNLAIAAEEFHRGNLRAACSFLDEAVECCGRTMYRTDHIPAAAGLYFQYMRRISATLSSNVIDDEEVNVYPALTDDFCRYAAAWEAREQGNEQAADILMKFSRKDCPYVLHYEAKALMETGVYDKAYEKLHALLRGDDSLPEPVLYFVFCDLEICCREIQDFKGAYEYSIDKMELAQKLLA